MAVSYALSEIVMVRPAQVTCKADESHAISQAFRVLADTLNRSVCWGCCPQTVSSSRQKLSVGIRTAEQETEESYTVRFYKGSVAVFDSHDKLYDILEIPSNILTDADREELNKGIHAKNKSELQSIIEDYSS